MKKSMKMLLSAGAALSLTAAAAFAQPVRFEQGPAEIYARTLEGGLPYSIETEAFQLLGKYDTGYLIYTDGKAFTVTASELGNVLDAVTEEELPDVSAMETLAQGARGDGVRALQSALHDLGYLSSRADGDFGKMSASAVSAFQEAMGLEATGEADPVLQALAISMAAEELVIGKYAPGEGGLDTAEPGVLDIYEQNGMAVQFDDMTGTGFISDDVAIVTDLSGSSDIEKYIFTLTYGFEMAELGGDEYEMTPVLRIDCECARRPMMESIILKSGDSRVTLEAGELTGSLSGASSVESASFIPDEAALALLAGAEENGELKLRVNGKYEEFDIRIPEGYLRGLSVLGRIALEPEN